MCSWVPKTRADLAYGWPTAEIAVTQTSRAAESIYGAEATEEQKAALEDKFMGPYQPPSAAWWMQLSP